MTRKCTDSILCKEPRMKRSWLVIDIALIFEGCYSMVHSKIAMAKWLRTRQNEVINYFGFGCGDIDSDVQDRK